MDERTRLEAYFMQSLEVDLLLRVCPDEEDTIHQIVNLLVDTCSSQKRRMLRVAGDDKPAEVVRSRFMKLNADHIRFVLKCLAEKHRAPVPNMKQYLLAALYNAPTTMQLYYQNQTNHDLSNRGDENVEKTTIAIVNQTGGTGKTTTCEKSAWGLHGKAKSSAGGCRPAGSKLTIVASLHGQLCAYCTADS